MADSGPADSEPLSQRLTAAVLDREEGYRTLDTLQDPATQSLFLWLEEVAPGFPDWLITVLFGGTYQRPGLSPRDRQLANLAALTALGGVDPQLAGQVVTSLRVGLKPEEVVEVFVHLAPYVGVPKALAGLRVAAAALEDAAPREADRSDLG
ncbi:carboxymuconolactone decarboxylase family protein [Streptomyces sp. NBC_00264]|uniref:carboxymuconolactone decarboxylase family protein n=1 Tax=unclassified Streptomyces TaxID=2593676 RepID=UPI000F5BA7D7|nr:MULTISPECIES: carboxymuconolactone decarboxylase family protein [unclassified Streptomyces]WSG52281.1 carboxymuconolactone decarboxylase family protein [Streptomyces sp. NBC_01732]WSX02913.1 carboxymuconolactone decarboxylase family protein [Streptomyces sp. NBC_00987]MCX4395152.1 carboxymuconolactone decarboxylase family protein [Streptomyces sp. NBC_01767]MCX5161734.1 carboxymuconolactone decarboxylase family protein [Streptomyces sp. NBC_00305]MCX5220257.1 carboxymuconolactone decarboxyl